MPLTRKYNKTDVGIVIGRFQTNDLHDAHLDLINTVVQEHEKVLIFLGIAPTCMEINNALPYEARHFMILEKFPKVIIQPIEDNRSDKLWSQNLDKKIRSVLNPKQSVTLYGSRDSFLGHYCGCFNVQELEAQNKVSATEIRNSISKKVIESSDFRSGVIWGAYNRYPQIYATVDIVVHNIKNNTILLARKPNEDKLRFVGGFTDPRSSSFEEDAAKELQEETGLTPGIDSFKYIGNSNIDDWRYRNSVNKIRTTFFYVQYDFGVAIPDDDLKGGDLVWKKLEDLTEDMFMEEHIVLFRMLKKNI